MVLPKPDLPQDYRDYLASPLWRRIRRRVLKRDGKRCARCGGEAVVVHHRSYAPRVLDGLADEWLASLCEGCHHIVEFDDFGRRRTDQERERCLLQPDARTDFPEPKVDLRFRYQKEPPGWERMTALQRTAYRTRAYEMFLEKKIARGPRKHLDISGRDTGKSEHALWQRRLASLKDDK
jgi:hypothetical protein